MGSIWREPEVHKSVLSYINTGHIPDDAFWATVEHRRELDPVRFDLHHPNVAGFLRPPDVIGQLPHGPLIDDLRRRFEVAPHRFTSFHPFWGRLFAHEPHPGVPVVPPVIPPVHGVPEPASIVPLFIGIVVAYVYLRNGH
jgi:hypothetical protein